MGEIPLAPLARVIGGHHAARRSLSPLAHGTFLERADNTARLLDVKFHAVQNDFFGRASERNQENDFYHWSAILRSVSAFEVYPQGLPRRDHARACGRPAHPAARHALVTACQPA